MKGLHYAEHYANNYDYVSRIEFYHTDLNIMEKYMNVKMVVGIY